jgi:hypothetical protein
MGQNYFLGAGVQINVFMVAATWKLKGMMEKLKEKIVRIIFRLLFL